MTHICVTMVARYQCYLCALEKGKVIRVQDQSLKSLKSRAKETRDPYLALLYTISECCRRTAGKGHLVCFCHSVIFPHLKTVRQLSLFLNGILGIQ